MNNSDSPAMPVDWRCLDEVADLCVTQSFGLTKREHIAAMAMQGLISNADSLRGIAGFINSSNDLTLTDDSLAAEISKESVRYADALLEELSK